MPHLFAKLSADWVMRSWSDVPFALVNRRSAQCHPLVPSAAYVARHCTGGVDFASVRFTPKHRAILSCLESAGVVERCSMGSTLHADQALRAAPNPYIKGVHWAVTNRCNLVCRHCYLGDQNTTTDLSLAQIRILLAQMEEAGVAEVVLTGGEPFARQDFVDILSLLADRRIKVAQIFTNGTLMTQDTLSEIMKTGVEPAFMVSFDGLGHHDGMRGVSGIEDTVLSSMKSIVDSGFDLSVSTSIDATNAYALAKTYDVLKTMNIKLWTVDVPKHTGRWKSEATDLTREQEADVYLPLLQRWHGDGAPFRLKLGVFFDSGLDYDGGKPTRFLRHYELDDYVCGYCKHEPHLTADATLLPCALFSDTTLRGEMPNLLRSRLSEVLTQSSYRKLVTTTHASLISRNEECHGCALFFECGCGCRAEAVHEGGDFLGRSSVACTFWKNGFKQRVWDALDQR